VSSLNEYLPPNEGVQHPEGNRRKRSGYPTGWEPHVVQSDNEASAISEVFSRDADEVELLNGWHMDPDQWEIEPGTLYVNRWEGGDGEWRYQYKARLKRRFAQRVDVDELLSGISRYKPVKSVKPLSDSALIICPSDLQIGKADGDGTEGTVLRVLDSWQRIIEHARKTKPAQIYIVGMGDLVENCDGHYAQQTFTVELDRRQQVRVVRRLLRDLVIGLSRLGIPLVVSGVAGNHGENRKDGKSFTTPGDNDDVAVFEMVAETLATNPEAFGHVNFHIPDDRLHVVFDIYDKLCGFAHGHIAGRGSTPQQKQQNWWKDHAFMQSPIGDAEYLTTAHYHHLSVVDHGPRVHFQCPAMDGGSVWWENRGGGKSRSGILTYTIDGDGWDNLRVL
jgi:hypothetical protein